MEKNKKEKKEKGKKKKRKKMKMKKMKRKKMKRKKKKKGRPGRIGVFRRAGGGGGILDPNSMRAGILRQPEFVDSWDPATAGSH